jgi:putative membrane-bound dehydrogenase-like protein
MKRTHLFTLIIAGAANLVAAQQHPETPPLSPAEGLASIRVPEGYEVELVVAEPLVMDPTAITWGTDGRLWVAEMTDYPIGVNNDGKPAGRVRWLKDTTGDGNYDQSVVFAEGLAFPNSVLPWSGGVLVTCAPEILHLEDTDGDGVSDKSTALFTGFEPTNQQLRINGLRWGLDNWIHCASGSPSVGRNKKSKITSVKTGEVIDLGSRDFRFRPDTGEMEAMSGPTQFGKNRDDWDNWFGCMNSYPLWHYVLEDRYLQRNPHITAPDPREMLVLPRNPKVYPAKTPQKRFHSFQHSGHYTSGCAAMIYRDELLFPPKNYNENAVHSFTCEPFHNLVQHNIIDNDPNGFSFSRAYRDPNETDTDFFASEDRWCRPVMARTGPDGALWVVDMYRYIIEHTQFLTPEAKEEFEGKYRRGFDRGRIYRVFPKGKKPQMPPVLDGMSSEELIAALDTPNGWVRDAIQRHPKLTNFHPSLLSPLARILTSPDQRPAALASAMAIAEQQDLFAKMLPLELLLGHGHPGVRRQAIRITEKNPLLSVDRIKLLLKSSTDPDAKVRLQFACTIGELPSSVAGPAIGKMAATDPLADSEFLQTALLSSVTEENIGATMIALLNEPDQKNSGPFTGRLLALAVAFGNDDATADGLLSILRPEAEDKDLQHQFETLGGLVGALERRKTSLEQVAAATTEKGASVLDTVAKLHIRAQQTAVDSKAPPATRIAAIQLLARTTDKEKLATETDLLFTQLNPATPSKVQAAIVTQLGRQRDPAIAERLLASWRGYPTAVHAETFNVLLARKEWMPSFFDAVEKGTVMQADVDLNSRQRLLVYPNSEIRKKLTAILADTTSPDRRKVIEGHQAVLKLKGDAKAGKLAFAKACMVCHKLGDQGFEIGPNLISITDKNPASLLSAILDPSASIDARYSTYVAELKDGRTMLGILVGETATNITLHDQANQKHSLLRSDIKSLTSTGRSLMPDGLEAALTHQELADIIAYVRAAK